MSVMKPGLTVDLCGDGAVIVNGQRFEPGSEFALAFREAVGADVVLGPPRPLDSEPPKIIRRRVTKIDKATRTVTFE